MKKTFTSTGYLELPKLEERSNGEGAIINVQGNSDDFVWSVEFSLDNWSTVSKIKTNGNSTFTGSDSKYIFLNSLGSEAQTRISIDSMGSATSITLSYSL